MDQGKGGFMVLLPTVAVENMTMTAFAAAMLPWNAPAFLGVFATTANGEPALTVSMEWPKIWMRTTEPIPKFDRESLFIRRFSSDQALATGTHACGYVQPGNDPPDTTVQTDNGSLGVESTALTVEARRGVHNLFLQLRRRLQSEEPAAFSKLAGHVIYVWFEESDVPALGRPHKRSDTAALEALVKALAEYEPKTDHLWSASGQFPEQMDELPLVDTPAGAKFYAVPITNAAPSTMLFTIAGFELGLVYTTFMTAKTAWTEVQRLVDSHDKPGVDVLLITAGGPDATGNVFPAEEVVADFVVDNPIGLTRSPHHIARVVLHSWATGKATLLHPSVEPLFGPLYGDMTPLHHPVVSPPDDSTDGSGIGSESVSPA
jgi:hypothetical protein